jgi:fluoride exporter
MRTLLWVALAGAAGTAARYLIGLWAVKTLPTNFPYATVIINLTGCFAIAVVAHVALANAWPTTLRATVVVGLLGGFTTYSSFNHETLTLLEQNPPVAFVNVAVTLLGGLAAGWLGLLSARSLT